MSLFAAPARAFKDLDFARSQPIRLACMLLSKRAEVMANRGQTAPSWSRRSMPFAASSQPIR